MHLGRPNLFRIGTQLNKLNKSCIGKQNRQSASPFFPISTNAVDVSVHSSSSQSMSALHMVRNRGLEVRGSGATPTEGGMILYVKAGPDGISVGDCPFAHFVRMVLHEKNLSYDLRPSTPETKPSWLIDFYEGKMPALRHEKECYIESDVIAEYLNFFFQQPELAVKNKKANKEAVECTNGFFPAVAKYLKFVGPSSEEGMARKNDLMEALNRIETHLSKGTDSGRTGPYLVGNGETFTLSDCSLAPKLYHLSVGIKAFKTGTDEFIDIKNEFNEVGAYIDAVFSRESFKETLYPEETVIWGWTKARE